MRGHPALRRPQRVVDGVRDRAGVVRDPPPERLRTAGQAEQCGDLVEILSEDPVPAAAGDQMQAVARVQQSRVGGAHRRSPGVGDLGVRDAAQHPHVTQPAARLLDVAVEQERQLALDCASAGW